MTLSAISLSDYQSCSDDSSDEFRDLVEDFESTGGLIMKDGRTPHPNSLVPFGNRFDTIQEELGVEFELSMEEERDEGREDEKAESTAVMRVMRQPLTAVKSSWKG